MLVEDVPAIQNINLVSTVTVTRLENPKQVSCSIPREIRITPQVLSLIREALEAQGVELTHLDIGPEHQADLGALPNVVLQPRAEQG